LTAVAALLLFAHTAVAQDSAASATIDCPDLRRIIDLAERNKTFSPIAGTPREGNFRETTIPLASWADCALYGTRTYACDSTEFKTASDAERAVARLAEDIARCLGERWGQDTGRSSATYVVLHKAQSPASLTLSTAPTDKGHLVHLIVFVRGSQP
jgi:hypothetical protein